MYSELSGSARKGFFVILEVAINGVFFTIGDYEKEDYEYFNSADGILVCSLWNLIKSVQWTKSIL